MVSAVGVNPVSANQEGLDRCATRVVRDDARLRIVVSHDPTRIVVDDNCLPIVERQAIHVLGDDRFGALCRVIPVSQRGRSRDLDQPCRQDGDCYAHLVSSSATFTTNSGIS